MSELRVPSKYGRCGIKVKCLKCKRQIGKGKCFEEKNNPKASSKCNFKEKHKYNLIVCVPNTKNSRRTRIIGTKDFDEALIELANYKKELKLSKFQKPLHKKVQENKNLFVELIADYLDFQSGVNTPSHLIRQRENDHISDCKRCLTRFCISLKNKGYNLEILEIFDVNDNEVGVFHDYLVNELKFLKGKSTYNRHFRIGKAFFNWVIKQKEMSIFNPFTKAELKVTITNKEYISKEEFCNLLDVVTFENGFDPNPKGKKENVYFPWLATAFRLGLETGLRNDEIIQLKWSDISSLDNERNAFEINDFKVNRKQFGNEDGSNKKIVPITASLLELLIELGLDSNVGINKPILDTNNYGNLKTIEKAISRGFGHYIKQVTTKPLQFKHLRKTFISHLVMALGEKAKLFTGHSDDEVLMRHYISQAWTAGGLSEFRVF